MSILIATRVSRAGLTARDGLARFPPTSVTFSPRVLNQLCPEAHVPPISRQNPDCCDAKARMGLRVAEVFQTLDGKQLVRFQP